MHDAIPANSVPTVNDSNRPDPDPQPNAALSLCSYCAAQMPETAAFCPACGRTIQPLVRAQGSVGRLPENVASALAYFTFIPALLFLAMEPYKRNSFLRFHSVQCLLLWAGAALAAAVIRLVGVLLVAIPVAGPLFAVLIWVVSGIFAFVIWVVLEVKALQGEMFKLPVIGDLAEKYANEV
jgi:uncharacterized membrane protein